MKRIIILSFLSLLFSSCSLTTADVTENEYNYSTYDYNKIEEISIQSEYILNSTETITNNNSKCGEENILGAIEELADHRNGMLYDFDFDNIPEVVILDYGMEYTFFNIFKYIDGKLLYCGEIMSDNNVSVENAVAHVDLYCNDNEYFYCANSISFVKNNSQDESGYGFYQGTLYKYVFSQNKMDTFEIFKYYGDYTDDNSLLKYFEECEIYLQQFKKMGTVSLEPLWNNSNVIDGSYKELIQNKLNEFTW